MITVSLGGYDLKEFEFVSFSRSLDALCGHFEVRCLPIPVDLNSIGDGEKLVIAYQGKTVFTGLIDTVSGSLGAESQSLTVSGRDVTSVLVDSSVIHSPMGFESVSLSKLAHALCDPFGIKVQSHLNKEINHPNWSLIYGETVFEALDRMAKIEGAFFLTSELGDLLIEKPWVGASCLNLVEGQNVLDMKFTKSQKGLFRKYLVSTYAQGLGNSIQRLSEVTDSEVKTNKTLIIDSDGFPDDLARKRLTYEMKTRRARSFQINAQVSGWVDDLGKPFQLNTLTQVRADSMGLLGKYLISGLEWRLDSEQGYTTQITLYPLDAYIPDPVAEIRLNALMGLMRRDH